MKKDGKPYCYILTVHMGHSMDAHFSSTRLSLDRGFVYAIAHCGGEDLGRNGMKTEKLKKKILSQTLLIVLNI
jgi:protease II